MSIWSNPWVRFVASLGALILLVLLVRLLVPILTPVLFAFMVAYALHPLVAYLETKKIPRSVTISILMAVFIILLACIPLLVIPGIIGEADSLIKAAKSDAGNDLLNRTLDRLPLRELVIQLGWAPEGQTNFDERAVLGERIGAAIKTNALDLLRGYGNDIAGIGAKAGRTAAQLLASIGRFSLTTIGLLVDLSLFLFVLVHMLLNLEKIEAGMAELIPLNYRKPVGRIMCKIDVQLRSFLRGQITVCLILMVLYSIGLKICGVPFAFPIGIMGGAANMIPYAGPAITLVPSLLLTLLYHGLDWHIVAVMVLFVCVQMTEGYILTPKIVGEQVGLHPVWVIVAILVFSSVLGFFGLLLAVPIAAVAKVLIEETMVIYRDSRVFKGPSSSESEESP